MKHLLTKTNSNSSMLTSIRNHKHNINHQSKFGIEKLVFLSLFAVLFLFLVSCEPDAGKKSITVQFQTNGGTKVPDQTISAGGRVTKPADPTHPDGYAFEKWLGVAGSSRYVYDFTAPLFTDLTIEAEWASTDNTPIFKVSFVDNDKDSKTSIAAIEVKSGEKLKKPADPTLPDPVDASLKDFVFDGWFTDDVLTTEYDFDAVVRANFTLYVKWSQPFVVTFDAGEGSFVNPATVQDGRKLEKPTNPVRDQFDFGGWFTDEALTVAYDFDAAVTDAFTLYAKWDASTANLIFMVTFDSKGGSAVGNSPVAVKEGSMVARPTPDPTRDGHTFAGWFTDSELTSQYNFMDNVNAPMTLYAKWNTN